MHQGLSTADRLQLYHFPNPTRNVQKKSKSDLRALPVSIIAFNARQNMPMHGWKDLELETWNFEPAKPARRLQASARFCKPSDLQGPSGSKF
jgi:hypothetical protein